jgi:hypothetical protein
MNPWECSECPSTIVWEGYDPEVHERLCGKCLFLIRKGEERERERIIGRIRDRVCFDALADHDEMAQFREAHPEVVGRCSHHGGKCTDLLLLIAELESK